MNLKTKIKIVLYSICLIILAGLIYHNVTTTNVGPKTKSDIEKITLTKDISELTGLFVCDVIIYEDVGDKKINLGYRTNDVILNYTGTRVSIKLLNYNIDSFSFTDGGKDFKSTKSSDFRFAITRTVKGFYVVYVLFDTYTKYTYKIDSCKVYE